MKILILHRIPFHKIAYDRGIDHRRHEVTYFGVRQILDTIPPGLQCVQIERPGSQSASVEALKIFGSEPTFDLVISLSEYELMEAALLRAAWSLPGPTVDDVLKVRDKIVMKDAVEASGISVPRAIRCSDLLAGNIIKRLWRGRTILKPVDGASSENVSVHGSPMEALAFTKEMNFSPEYFEVEEFVEGDILHFDGLVESSELKVITLSQYIGTCLDYAKGRPLGSFQCEISDDAKVWAKKCLSAVGISNGSFHLEAIRARERLVFLEVGARVGGADVVDTFELKTGVHLPSSELRIYLPDEQPREDGRSAGSKSFFGWFVFPGHHLLSDTCQIVAPGDLLRSSQIVRWNQLERTQRLPKKITYQSCEVPAAGIVKGNSSQAVKLFMESIFAEVKINPLTSTEVSLCG